MTFDVDVVIPCWGTQYEVWAHERALPSVLAQTLQPASMHLAEGRNPADARNAGAELGSAEWLCFLDADDELDPQYLRAMSRGRADVRGPATTFHKPHLGVVEGPLLVPVRDLETQHNYLVVGTLLRRELFDRVGRWRDWPVHEDYDLWLRCLRAGATFEQLPRAIYHVHERARSRNTKSLAFKRRVDQRIREASG